MSTPNRVVSALPPGTAFSCYLMVLGAGKGDMWTELTLAENFKYSPQVHATLELRNKSAGRPLVKISSAGNWRSNAGTRDDAAHGGADTRAADDPQISRQHGGRVISRTQASKARRVVDESAGSDLGFFDN